MASPVCGMCSRRSKESIAIKFCSDCEDPLCCECVDVHGVIKAFVSHHIVDVTLAAEQAFTVNKTCSKHSEMISELYCSDHDTICCRSCMVEHHRTCEKLIPIDVAARDVKRSTMFADVSESIGNLNKTADELQKKVQMSSATLNDSKDVVKKRVTDLKDKLLQRIAQLETQIVSEVESVFATLSDKIENNKKTVDDRVKAIKEISSRFDFIVNHGSDSQIFHVLHSMNLNIHDTGKNIEELIPSLASHEMVFNESDLLSVMKTLGSISVTEILCDIHYKPPKNQQAQILQNSRTIKKLELEKTVSIPSTGNLYISGIAATKDNRLILCNQLSYGLIVLTEDGQHIKNITLPSCPWGIAVVPDNDEVWVTLPELRYLQIVSTVTYTPIRQVNAPCDQCYGITMVGNNVALGGSNGKVYIINKQGVRLKELSTGTGDVHSLCVKSADKLFCCAANDGKFLCIKLDGTIEFSYSSQELIGPIAAITDDQGNVYVIGYKSNNLHRFSAEGKLLEIMLTSTDGLKSPYSLAFNRNFSKLLIPNFSDKTLRIFSCY